MDEQYPKRYLGENSNVNSRQKMSESSSHFSKSFRGTLSAMSQRNYYEDDVSADDSKYFSQQCTSFITGNYTREGDLEFFVFAIIKKLSTYHPPSNSSFNSYLDISIRGMTKI